MWCMCGCGTYVEVMLFLLQAKIAAGSYGWWPLTVRLPPAPAVTNSQGVSNRCVYMYTYVYLCICIYTPGGRLHCVFRLLLLLPIRRVLVLGAYTCIYAYTCTCMIIYIHGGRLLCVFLLLLLLLIYRVSVLGAHICIYVYMCIYVCIYVYTYGGRLQCVFLLLLLLPIRRMLVLGAYICIHICMYVYVYTHMVAAYLASFSCSYCYGSGFRVLGFRV